MTKLDKLAVVLRGRFPHEDRVQYRDGRKTGRKCYPECDRCFIEHTLRSFPHPKAGRS